MVSFEVQENAEFLINQVAAIEVASKRALEGQEKIRRGNSSNMMQHPDLVDCCPAEQSLQLLPLEICGDAQPLADDLSSHLSESDCSIAGATRRDGSAFDDIGFDVLQWYDNFLSGSQVPSMHTMYDSVTRSKLAMHQILLNSDLKIRKLQYEVYMQRRVYEDAKLTIERLEHKIALLERNLSKAPQTEHEMDEISAAAAASDLRMANHLNKLLASRNKALDENLTIKKQLLSCCTKCRSRISDKHGGTDPGETHLEQPPQASAQRPTFQQTAFAMVQRIGQRIPLAETRSGLKSSLVEEKKTDSSVGPSNSKTDDKTLNNYRMNDAETLSGLEKSQAQVDVDNDIIRARPKVVLPNYLGSPTRRKPTNIVRHHDKHIHAYSNHDGDTR